jgi:hypothetical protein
MTEGTDISALTAEQASQKLAEMEAEFRGVQYERPDSKLNDRYADPAWRAKLEAGDGKTHAEFQELAKAAAEMSPVDAVMTGVLLDVPTSQMRLMEEHASYLRSLGLSEVVVREGISGEQSVSQEIHDAAVDWKKKATTNRDWVKEYLSGSVEHVKQMTLCQIVLNNPIKGKK